MNQPKNADLPEGIVKDILEGEESYRRFEQLCCDLFTEADQRHFLPTSRSWDLARDGRAIPDDEGRIGFICCGLEFEYDEKCKSDLARLLKFCPEPDTVYFCTPRFRSEHYLDEVNTNLAEQVPETTRTAAYDGNQLLTLICRHRTPFENRYWPELTSYRSFLDAPPHGTSQSRLARQR